MKYEQTSVLDIVDSYTSQIYSCIAIKSHYFISIHTVTSPELSSGTLGYSVMMQPLIDQ